MDAFEKPTLEHHLDRVRAPFKEFLRTQTLASGLLLSGLIAALIMVNGGWTENYRAVQELVLSLQVGGWELTGNLLGWMNDGLIAVFFFLIGLEIKREFLAGTLRFKERRILLIAAALGGMLLPAALYTVINLLLNGVPRGWGIPMATDTALAIGVLVLLRNRIPQSLTAFLVGLAIIDDIGAVLVIAMFYSSDLAWTALSIAGGIFGALVIANQAGLRHPLIYLAGAVGLWIFLHEGGVHSSIAGVLAAVTVPARPRVEMARFERALRQHYRDLRKGKGGRNVLANEDEHAEVRAVEDEARRATTPLRRWEDSLDLPVALLILPAFAFLNGGIGIDVTSLRQLVLDPVALGIITGLVLGKPLGILGATWLSTRLGLADLPEDTQWRHLAGLGLVAGIGFTMSTFISNLALTSGDSENSLAKLAILAGSLIAGSAGLLMLWKRTDATGTGMRSEETSTHA